ncbi:MAG: hypothetical protein ACJ74J_18755 [Blastocatellia bacterium]
MRDEIIRSHIRVATVLLLAGLFLLTQAGRAIAADLKQNQEPAVTTQTPPAQPAEPESATQPAAVTVAIGNTGQASSSATAQTPLTPGQKFKYSLRSSFKPPTPYALSALSGVFSEATDKDHGRHMSAGDFLADSATHAARSMAFRVTANFFEKFAFAAAFHQDPRYFRSDRHGFGRIGYALSRVVITQGDNGHNQFNASFFAGGLVTAGISNVWSRPEDRTVSSTLSRFGLHVAYRGLSNVIHEVFGKR